MRSPPRSPLFPYTTLFRSNLFAADPILAKPIQISFDPQGRLDRKSTRLNSSHVAISYAVFCLKKKTDNRSDHYQRTSLSRAVKDRCKSPYIHETSCSERDR